MNEVDSNVDSTADNEIDNKVNIEVNNKVNNNKPPLQAAKRLSQALLISLIALYIIVGLTETPILWTLIIVPCLSLVIFLPGMLQNHARSYDWLCFVLLIHFTVGVTNSMSPHVTWNDYVQTVLTVVLFISAMMTSRWQKAALRPEA